MGHDSRPVVITSGIRIHVPNQMRLHITARVHRHRREEGCIEKRRDSTEGTSSFAKLAKKRNLP